MIFLLPVGATSPVRHCSGLHHPGAVLTICLCFLFQKYRHHDEDSSPQDQSSPQLTEEGGGPELVHVAEKNLSQIENVHGYVTHTHISPMKVRQRVMFFCLQSRPSERGVVTSLANTQTSSSTHSHTDRTVTCVLFSGQ